MRADAKNCFYPIIVQNEEIVGFGDVTEDSFHPENQTVTVDDKYYIYPMDRNNVERKWRYARQTVESIKHLLRVKKTNRGYDIELGKDFGVQKTVWTDPKFDASVNGTQLLRQLVPNTVFSYPKSIYTVIECVNAVVKNDKNAIILDFFGGSGTTGHAVMEINKDGGHRKFILVEQMDYVETDTLARNIAVQKNLAIEDSIVYCELAKLNQSIVEEIEAATDDDALAAIWQKMKKSGFISCKVDPAAIDEAAEDFAALSLADKKKFLMELLDKNLLYVNTCDMDDAEFNISEIDKAFTKSFYKEA